jgi:SNF2 family DNA or RNA helicase
VLTTFDTMSSEWRPKQPIECSPLMQVHWLRIILDEGHKVGSVAMTNKLQMAMCLHAERRWVMTGTPTPSDASVDKLQPLLAFLQHQPYGSEPESWKRAVQAPFERREEVGRLRLLALLNGIMIRASKVSCAVTVRTDSNCM